MQHHHIPAEALKLARRTQEYDYTYSIKRFIKAYSLMTDIHVDLDWMDRAGVDVSILSTAAFVANGYDFCRVCNDGYGKVVRQFPDRYKGLIHVFPLDNKAINRDEMKRGVEELGLWGIGVVTSFLDLTIDSPRMDHIYDMAVEYDMPVFVHPTIRNNIWGGEKYDLFLTAAREYDIAKAFVEIIYGVVPRYPTLKVIMPHLAGGLPALLGRLMAKHQPKDFNIQPEDRGQWIPVRRAEELGLVDNFKSLLNSFYFDTAGSGGWVPVVKFAIEVLDADHLCFGTDFPYDLNDPQYVAKYIADIQDLNVPDGDKEKLLGATLGKLFHIVYSESWTNGGFVNKKSPPARSLKGWRHYVSLIQDGFITSSGNEFLVLGAPIGRVTGSEIQEWQIPIDQTIIAQRRHDHEKNA